MSYFEFDQTKIFYRIKGKGEPLLLLHGNTASSLMFDTLLNKYLKNFKVITLDFPGHGKSDRLQKFETDFWFYNAVVTNALLDKLELDKVSVVGTSGGALVAINLALEHPAKVKHLIADSFEGAYPLPSYIESIEADRARDKKKLMAKFFWWYCHGLDWKKIVDLDTKVIIEFSATGKSFFHKSISELKAPTLLTGSLKDEFCDHLDKIYADLKKQNDRLEIHLFEEGNHPAMLSNKNEFFDLVKERVK